MGTNSDKDGTSGSGELGRGLSAAARPPGVVHVPLQCRHNVEPYEVVIYGRGERKKKKKKKQWAALATWRP